MTPLADPVARLRELADGIDRRSKKLSGISESQMDHWSESIRAIASSIEGQALNAARYEWLLSAGLEVCWNRQVSFSPGYVEGDAEAMNAAIDAARTAAQKDRT